MNLKWSYSPETPNLGQNRCFVAPCDLEIWRMTLKNNTAPLLSNIKPCASFHRHMWIQIWVTVRKRLSGVMTSVTLTFYLWPWPFAWTSLLSMVITPENFVMIRWQEHGERGVTDGQTDTDGRTDWSVLRSAWSQLKTEKNPTYQESGIRNHLFEEIYNACNLQKDTYRFYCTYWCGLLVVIKQSG